MTITSTTVGKKKKQGSFVVNKSPKSVLGCNLKNDRMIYFGFQGKPFNITVIQVYAPNTNAKEVEVE